MNAQDTGIKVGLAAFGMSGRVFHAPLLHAHAGFHLHSVLQRQKNIQQDVRKKYPELQVVNAYQDLLQDKAIELIIVNTPEHLHYEMAAQALEADKHVVVEKAFTTASSEAKSLIALAQKKGRILSVFQNSRWHGDFLTIKNILNHQLLGRCVDYEAHYDRYRKHVDEQNWKELPHPGTGVLYNLGSHMIDQVLVLFGWPQEIQADLRVQRTGGKVYDNFELIMYYDQLRVSLKSSYLVREPGPRYVLHGTEGSFVKHGADPQEAALKAGDSPLEESWGKEAEALWGKINTQVNGLHVEGKVETIPASYMGFYDNLYAAIRQGEALAVTAEQAMQVIAVIEAAYQSHEEKRRISLDSPP